MFTSDFPINFPQDNSHEDAGTSSASWNQQPPQSVPWSVVSHPRVARFSGSQDKNFNGQAETPSFQFSSWNPSERSWEDHNCFPFIKPAKRKGEDLNTSIVRKQFITEEKIAAHMSQLQISSQEDIPSVSSKIDIQESSTNTCEALKIGPDSKLVLSQELKRFQQESSIPQLLLESLRRPSMAVVLWQPRNPVHLLASTSQDSQSEETATQSRPVRQESRNNDADIEIVEDDSNNNEPIGNFNLNHGNEPNEFESSDLDMDEDL